MINRLSVIIPVYNEGSTIRTVLEKVKSVELVNGISKQVIIVNDASSDESLSEVEAFVNAQIEGDYKVINHSFNKGKGAGIRTGLNHADGEYSIIQDADLELDPNEYNLLLDPILKGEADVVYGSRFLNNPGASSGTLVHRAANSLLTGFSNLVFRTRLTDMETCYKLMPTAAIKNIMLKEERFGFEPEITAKLARIKHLKFAEVPITYQARTSTQGKKIGWSDGFRAVWCILKYGWLTPRSRIFYDPDKRVLPPVSEANPA